ncbi:MAG: TetR/AcrR family transcriptional regulator [Fibrobacterales bacterium]
METRKEKNRRRNVEEILNATSYLIAEKGITNISVDDIAKKADFGKGTLYNYFKNKEDIIWSLVEKVFSEFLAEISQTVPKESHISDKMRQVLTISHDYFLKQVALNEILAFLEYSSWQVQNSDVFNKSCQFFDSFHAPFIEMFEQAMERGEIKKTDAHFLSISFFTNLSAIKKCMIRGILSEDDIVVSELLMNSFFKEL